MTGVMMWRNGVRLSALGLAMGMAAPAHALTLSEALTAAFNTDPVAAAALAERDVGIEVGVQERATRLPQINAIGNMTTTDSRVSTTPFGPGFKERYNGWDAAVQLRQPLFRYDFLARGRRADAQDQLAEMGFVARSQALMARVAERYLGVLQAQNEMTLAEAEAEAVAKSLSDTRKRFEVQLIPGTDLKEAQARNDLAQAQLLSARQNVAAARDALDESTGRGYEPLAVLAESTELPALNEASPEAWLKLASIHSPSLLKAQASLAVAEANVSSQRSKALPSLDFVASHGRQDQSDSQVGVAGNSTAYGIELTVPIFASGANVSRIRQAQASLRSATAERDRTSRELKRETQRLVRDVHTAQAQASAYARAAESAQAAEQATRYGYEAGKRTIVDVLNAQSSTVQARRTLDQSRYGVLLKTLQLKQQVGILTPHDIAAIDTLLSPAN
ncbi:MAG: TolC family outer membrane protein [Paraperlucidibaca sp.]